MTRLIPGALLADPDSQPSPSPTGSRRLRLQAVQGLLNLLAGVTTRLGLDYFELLKASPRKEVRMIYDALKECERYGDERPA